MQYAIWFLARVVGAVLIMGAVNVLAQAPSDTITLRFTRPQAAYLEELLRKKPIEEAGGLYYSIQSQITDQGNAQLTGARENFEREVREKIAAEAAAKAKAEAEKNKAPVPIPTPAPEPKE